MCGSLRVRGGNPKSVWWNDQVKAAVKRKEDALKKVLGARDEDAREMCLEVYKGLIDDEQGGFREGRGCADQIFTLKQIVEKA